MCQEILVQLCSLLLKLLHVDREADGQTDTANRYIIATFSSEHA
jgi:hypothetical protein